MARTADPQVRTALIEAAARLLAHGGVDALTTRALAREVGTSTMAVYTHFGSMADLRIAVRHEGFARLADHLNGVRATDDPVADILVLGVAYHTNAATNPDLYRVMFVEPLIDERDSTIGRATLDVMVDASARAVKAGRFHGSPEQLAEELWAIAHGVVTLQLAGFMDAAEARQRFATLGRHLILGFGDDPSAYERSTRRARRRQNARRGDRKASSSDDQR